MFLFRSYKRKPADDVFGIAVGQRRAVKRSSLPASQYTRGLPLDPGLCPMRKDTRAEQQHGMWQFWIDRGGTFTDIVARDPGRHAVHPQAAVGEPRRYRDAAIAGIRTVLGLAPDEPIPPGLIEAVKMGTTVATNALLERKGDRTLLLVNSGFADALRIGNQARPRLFDLAITLPTMLYEQVVEIAGRVGVDGTEIEPLDEAAARDAFWPPPEPMVSTPAPSC